MRAALCVLGALTMALWCAPLRAEGPAPMTPPTSLPPEAGSSSAEADALFLEGRALLGEGKYAEACVKLERSHRIASAVGTLLNLGFCHERLGRMRSAMEAYSEAEILARRAGDPKRAAFALERIAAVSPRMTKVTIRVSEPDTPGLVVKRNDEVLPKTDYGVPVPLDPGDIVITASAPGRTPRTITLKSRGEGAELGVLVPALEARREAPVKEAPGFRLTAKRAGAVGLGAVGVGAIASAVVLALSAKARYDDSLAFCDGSGCDPRAVDAQRGARVHGNIATLIGALGLAAAGAGTYMWITGAPKSGSSPGGVALTMGSSF